MILKEPLKSVEPCACLNGSLHVEMVLQIVGEGVVYDSIWNIFEKGSIYHQKGSRRCYNVNRFSINVLKSNFTTQRTM